MTNLASLLALAIGPEDQPPTAPKLGDSPYFWLPRSGSTTAGPVDSLFDYIMWINVLSTIALLGMMIYFTLKYRAASRKTQPTGNLDHHTGLELLWSIVPFPFLLAFPAQLFHLQLQSHHKKKQEKWIIMYIWFCGTPRLAPLPPPQLFGTEA